MAFGDFTVDRNSTKYVLGSGGDIISYATDEPAFEFNTDGSYKGLLVEPAATNLAVQSENFNTTWTAVYATPTQDTEETPDGDTSSKYIKIVDNNDSGSGSVQVFQADPITAGTQYTFSVFLKAANNNWAQLDLYDSVNTASYRRYFDLQNGVLGSFESVEPDDSQIVAYPNGWYRCSITATCGASNSTGNFYISVAEADLDKTLTRDGSHSIYAWGAQFEQGPIATSYIPTTTATVTRNKDDITLGSASSLIGQTEGTVYVEVDWRASGTNQRLIEIGDETNDNRIIIYHDGSGGNLTFLLQANGSSVFTPTQSSSGFSGIQKVAFAYANGDQEAYRNGSSIATGTGSLASLATLTEIGLGIYPVGSSLQANMHIRAAALFTRRLSDAECQALTTL